MILRRLRIVLAIIAIYLGVAVATASPGNRTLYPARAEDMTVVYVINNGFHTDIAIPAPAVAAYGGILAMAADRAPAQPWKVFGWGDASFYTASGFSTARVRDGMRALFKPGNPSVIRIFSVSHDPAKAFGPGVATPIRLSTKGLDRMLARIERSMAMRGGQPVPAAARTTPDEVFYDSVENFSILRLCNHWTADMLGAAGLPMTPLLDGLAPTLMADLALRSGVKPPH